MDEHGNVYRAPEDKIPEADKQRLLDALKSEYAEIVASQLEKIIEEEEKDK